MAISVAPPPGAKRHSHSILQVTLNLIKDILGGTSQKNGTGLGILALGKEGKVLITDELNVEETTSGTDVSLTDILNSVDNGSTGSSGNSVVVTLSDSSQGSNITL